MGHVLALLLLPAASFAAKNEDLIADVIDWVRSHNGTINPHVEARPLPQTEKTVFGVFANEALEEGEVVCRVPWDLVIKPQSDGGRDCSTVWSVHGEIQSRATPYGQYLSKRPRRTLPGYWTSDGRTLLREMLGERLPPQKFDEIIADTWTDRCDEEKSSLNSAILHARLLVTTRSDGPDNAHLVPFLDLINHRNGRWSNAKTLLRDGEHYELVATRRVEPGEQIHTSYNRCDWCNDWRHYFGTPELFEQFGFVELMPQRWVIEDARLKFDVDEMDDRSGKLKVVFHVPPSERGVAYMREGLELLQRFEQTNKLDKAYGSLPYDEFNLLWEYFGAITDAFTRALESAEGQVSEEVWDLGPDWYTKESEGTVAAAHHSERAAMSQSSCASAEE